MRPAPAAPYRPSRRRSFAGRGFAVVLVAFVLLLVAACDSSPDLSARPSLPTQLGELEGELDLIAWDGYVERTWLTPFETATGCKVNATLATSADQMAELLATGEHDGVSASGYLTGRLIADGHVAPVNTALIPNYAGIFEGLKGQPHNTVDGLVYGVPHGRGANVLMWRTDIVDPAPTSWASVYDPASPYAGRITTFDAPIAIADAAVYLMTAQPDLEITNPYALDETQFEAAVELLAVQKPLVGRRWSLYTDAVIAFTDGDAVVGTGWQVIRNILAADGVPVETTLPVEGATGWSDTWMLSSQADHPNCMYAWMDHIISPAANAAATVYFGEAPVSRAACDEAETLSPGHCATFHAADEEYFSKVHYWATPQRDCGDERGPVCKDWADWVQAWAEIRG